MSFNTRPSTINEINGWVSARLSNVHRQMEITPEDDPLYEYLLERKQYLEKFIEARQSMIGKTLPENPRDKWKKWK